MPNPSIALFSICTLPAGRTMPCRASGVKSNWIALTEPRIL